MRQKLKRVTVFFATMVLLLNASKGNASHIAGCGLRYVNIAGNTYEVILEVYANCSSSATFSQLSSATPEVVIYNGGTYLTTLSLAIKPPNLGTEVSMVCASQIDSTTCTNTAFALPGIKEFSYACTITLPAASSCWRFIFDGNLGSGGSAARMASITNLTSASSTLIELVDTLNNLTFANSSPNLLAIATPFFGINGPNVFNPGAVDPDGDSLRFMLTNAMNGTGAGGTGGSCGYVSPCSGQNPLGVPTMTSSMSFSSTTGEMSFYPISLYKDIVDYNIEEFLGSTLVGTSQWEMCFLTSNTTSALSNIGYEISTDGVILSPYVFEVSGFTGSFSIDLGTLDTDPSNFINVSYAGLPAGASLTTFYDGTNHPICSLSWSTTGVTPGIYNFYVTLSNSSITGCNEQVFTFTIIIDGPTSVMNLERGDFAVYPNPAKSTIFVSCVSEEIEHISIFNTLGQSSYTLPVYKGKKAELDISSLPKGLYFIEVNHEMLKKFMKE